MSDIATEFDRAMSDLETAMNKVEHLRSVLDKVVRGLMQLPPSLAITGVQGEANLVSSARDPTSETIKASDWPTPETILAAISDVHGKWKIANELHDRLPESLKRGTAPDWRRVRRT